MSGASVKRPGVITQHLAAWGRGGDAEAALFDLLSPELDKLARSVLAKNVRLQRHIEASELVSETYIRLKKYVGSNRDVSFENRRRFYALVLTVMRNVLTDGVRKGGKARPKTSNVLTVGHADGASPASSVDAYDFYLTLDRLREKNQRQAEALELHYVAGWPLDTCADMLGISTATLKRQLVSARQWFDVQLRTAPAGA